MDNIGSFRHLFQANVSSNLMKEKCWRGCCADFVSGVRGLSVGGQGMEGRKVNLGWGGRLAVRRGERNPTVGRCTNWVYNGAGIARVAISSYSKAASTPRQVLNHM